MTAPTDEQLELAAQLLAERLNLVALKDRTETVPARRSPKPAGPPCWNCGHEGRHYTLILDAGPGATILTRIALCNHHGHQYLEHHRKGSNLTVGGRRLIGFDPTIIPLDEILTESSDR